MQPSDFISKAEVGGKIEIEDKAFFIKEIVGWRMLRSGGFYHKYSLVDENRDAGYRLAEDPESGRYILVHLFALKQPGSFLPEYEIEGKKFKFSYGEICVVEWQKGEGEHKKGSYDIWWDYEAEDGSYMSLGTTLPAGIKEDLIGKWITPEKVEIFSLRNNK